MNEQYYWWNKRPRPMTRKEIEEMKKNMRKVDVVHKKAEEYRKKEEKNVDKILEKIKN